MLGVAHHLIGNQDKAVQFCESAMVHNPGSQRLNIGHLGYDDRIVALVALARGLWLTGRPDRAIEAARYTVREAEQLEQPLTLGISLIWTIYVFLWVGDWANAESLIERLIDHSARHFLGPYHAVGIGQKGELLLRRGDVAGGIEHLRRSQATLYATRHRIMTTVFATALAEGLVAENQPTRPCARSTRPSPRSAIMANPSTCRRCSGSRATSWSGRATPRRPRAASGNR